jgi:hypothetical protein
MILSGTFVFTLNHAFFISLVITCMEFFATAKDLLQPNVVFPSIFLLTLGRIVGPGKWLFQESIHTYIRAAAAADRDGTEHQWYGLGTGCGQRFSKGYG